MKTYPGWRQVGQALRWARQCHGADLTYAVEQLGKGRILRTWDANNSAVWVTWTPGENEVCVHAEFTPPGLTTIEDVKVTTASAVRALNVLVGMDVLPITFSTSYRTGRVAGAHELTARLTADLETYAVVERTGKAITPGRAR